MNTKLQNKIRPPKKRLGNDVVTHRFDGQLKDNEAIMLFTDGINHQYPNVHQLNNSDSKIINTLRGTKPLYDDFSLILISFD